MSRGAVTCIQSMGGDGQVEEASPTGGNEGLWDTLLHTPTEWTLSLPVGHYGFGSA